MRNLKKIITTVLAAAMITTCTFATTPSVSYAESATEYTSATDLELNKVQLITIDGKDSNKEYIYKWYKFNAAPETKMEIILTKLKGKDSVQFYIYDSTLKMLDTGNSSVSSHTVRLGKDTTYYVRLHSGDTVEASMTIKAQAAAPTEAPTVVPTEAPTEAPTEVPTEAPTEVPTEAPTAIPENGSDIGNVDTDFWTEDGNTGSGVYNDELPVPEIKDVANISKTIDITWTCTSTSDIDGYYIYRSTDGKSWNKIATINDTEIGDYEDTDVTNGQGYGYILRSYVETSQSENSIPGYTCFLEKINVKSVKSNAAKKLTVKWSKNEKASGYQIRISTTKSFTKTTTETTKINSKTKSTKTIGNLKGGKKYFVQIRAYRSYNGEIYYSEWSSSKSLKVKR